MPPPYRAPYIVEARKTDDEPMTVWGTYNDLETATIVEQELVGRHGYFAAVILDANGQSVDQVGT